MVEESSGRAHSKAETSGSRLHFPQRLANECMRFEVKSKLPKCHLSKGNPKWVVKSTSNYVERSEEDANAVPTESYGCGDSGKCCPEVVLVSSGTGLPFKSAVPHSSRNEGVSGSKNNHKCHWVTGLSSGMAHARAVSIGKRI